MSVESIFAGSDRLLPHGAFDLPALVALSMSV